MITPTMLIVAEHEVISRGATNPTPKSIAEHLGHDLETVVACYAAMSADEYALATELCPLCLAE